MLTLTVSEEHEDVLEALRAGARGYVVKSSAQEEVVPRCLATARGEAWLSPKVAGQLVDDSSTCQQDSAGGDAQGGDAQGREQMVLARLGRA